MTTPQPFFSLQDLGTSFPSSTSQMLSQWLTAMQTAFPGYEPSAGNIEYIQAQIFASIAADLAQQCSAGADALFQTFGTDLLGLPVQTGTPALAIVTVAAVDSAGYLLPSGTQVLLTDATGAPLGFQTAADLIIPAGSVSGTVVVAAVQPGSGFNGAGAPAQLNLTVNWVQSVTAVAAASGGIDAEDPSHYLTRLRQTLQLLAPRPITATDYAMMALDFTPAPGTDQQEVGRATAIDGYDPTADTYNNQREVTVCVADANGEPLDSDTLAAVQAWFQSLREVNFIVNVVNPNYSGVYVTVTVKAAAGYDVVTVQTAVQQALIAYLSPSNFGLPVNSNVGWTNTTFVRLSRIEALIQNTSGVDYLVQGTLNIGLSSPPSNVTADVQLPGPFPLPMATTTTIPLSAINVRLTGDAAARASEGVVVRETIGVTHT